VTAQVAGDDFMPAREEVELRLPVLVRTGEAVD
jgi:hypothetical protein